MFEVKEWLFYECGPEVPLKSIDSSPLVVFMSGLDLGNPENAAPSLDLLQQWIYGNIEMPDDLNPANVVRVVIAGNSLRACAPKVQKNMSALTLRTIDTKDMLTSLKLLDSIISEMSQSVNVDLMPGEFDPSNHMLPQQPFHHCMFPKSAVNRTFNGVPNPYQFEIEGRLTLGTSGQNIDDIMKYSNVDDPIKCLENSLKWSHIAPTCPDTLPCYPYYDEDPFIINQCPHVYFCAQNDARFKTEVYKSENITFIDRVLLLITFYCSQTQMARTLDCSQFHPSRNLAALLS
jgi:DNA polymerase delta subunit 2